MTLKRPRGWAGLIVLSESDAYDRAAEQNISNIPMTTKYKVITTMVIRPLDDPT